MTEKQFEIKQAQVSDKELIETIETKLSKLCKTGGSSLTMSVPPQVSDFDMATCELIRRYKQLILPVVTKRFNNLNDALGYLNRGGHDFKERNSLNDETIIAIANDIYYKKNGTYKTG